MRISKNKRIITLGRDNTRTWENGGERGDRFRREVREAARELANQTGKRVEIYASASAGGWMADEVYPDDRD